MPELNMCDKIELLTDEYFHGELSPEDKKILEEHIKSCEKCAEFFEGEKIYFENIKSAEFVPEINIAESVMNIIISEQRTVDKPAKKRYVPFGLISAAAIVLVMFIASRGTLNLFKNTVNESEGSIKEEEEAQNIMLDAIDGNGNASGYSYIDEDYESDIDVHGGEAEVFAIPQIRAMIETGEAEVAEEAADEIAPVAEAPAPVPAIEMLMETAEAIPEPSEIIKIRRGKAEDFDFAEYIFIGESIFITKEYKDAIIKELKIQGIYFEIENTGIESEHIEIIYID